MEEEKRLQNGFFRNYLKATKEKNPDKKRVFYSKAVYFQEKLEKLRLDKEKEAEEL